MYIKDGSGLVGYFKLKKDESWLGWIYQVKDKGLMFFRGPSRLLLKIIISGSG